MTINNDKPTVSKKENVVVVSKMEKTTLTEQWQKGELEEYKKYYCKTKWFEDIFQARCYNKDAQDEWWVLKNEKYNYNNVYHTKDIEVLAEVPSYEEWLENESHCAVYSEVNQVLKKENQNLKELLKECRNILEDEGWYLTVKRIDEVLK